MIASILITRYLDNKETGRKTSMDSIKKYFLVLNSSIGLVLTMVPIGLIFHSNMNSILLQVMSLILEFASKLLILNSVIFIISKHLCVFYNLISLNCENMTLSLVFIFAFIGSLGLSVLEFVVYKPLWIHKIMTEQYNIKFQEISYSTLSLLIMAVIILIYHQIRMEITNLRHQDTNSFLFKAQNFSLKFKSACSRQVQLNEEHSRNNDEFRKKLLVLLCILSWTISALLLSKSFMPLVIVISEFMFFAGIPLYQIHANYNLRCYSYRKIKSIC